MLLAGYRRRVRLALCGLLRRLLNQLQQIITHQPPYHQRHVVGCRVAVDATQVSDTVFGERETVVLGNAPRQERYVCGGYISHAARGGRADTQPDYRECEIARDICDCIARGKIACECAACSPTAEDETIARELQRRYDKTTAVRYGKRGRNDDART